MNGNKMGPENMGPKTGRGLGFCTGHEIPGWQYTGDDSEAVKGMGMCRNAGLGKGRGSGRFCRSGRGFGRGRGRGFGMTLTPDSAEE